ncbi:hypothetical protein [Streptomyces himalayensis]|uniref:Uncharacterized protein n=1 Tax=Streptomyces himalayensis subsp. himalayensis TaxID=2756131 RepID=A0A7W0I792_9ACTN|nr:hypothetical protein [Streptomyces himalayensis]MBA2944928.1 hypothetical protein [Streptomyces himalayensis subsp. himalayensis]
MATTLPVKVEFSLPEGWQSAPPDEVGAPGVAFVALHPDSRDGFTANITIAGKLRGEGDTATGEGDTATGEGDLATGEGDLATGEGDLATYAGDLVAIADESVQRLSEAATVRVAKRTHVGTLEAPGFTQTLRISTTLRGWPLDLVQSQVYLVMQDVHDPAKRAVIELALTARPSQLDAVADDFKEFVRSFRPAEPAAA